MERYKCRHCNKEFENYACNIKTSSPSCSKQCAAFGRIPPSQKGKTAWNKGTDTFQLQGEKNGVWKGDKVTYRPLHSWVERMLGKPCKCEFCLKDGLTGHKIHWANKSHLYKRDLTDWIRLCAKCHKGYDLQTI